jgi:hypothetical protein
MNRFTALLLGFQGRQQQRVHRIHPIRQATALRPGVKKTFGEEESQKKIGEPVSQSSDFHR